MKRPPTLDAALRAWFQLVADEAAGTLPPAGVVKTRYDAVMRAWTASGDAAETTYLDVIEAWVGEGKPCPTCGKAVLCPMDLSPAPPGPVYLVLTWEPEAVA